MRIPLLKIFLQKSIVRYAAVGAIATLFDGGALYLFTEFAQFHYLVSAAIGFSVGVFVNYILSIHWVFKERVVANAKIEFLIFAVIGVLGLLWNEVIIYGLVDKLQVHYLLAKGISVLLVFFWNYFARKTILFSVRK